MFNAKIASRGDFQEVGRVLILVCYYSLESFENLSRELALDKKRKIKSYDVERYKFVIDFLVGMIKLPTAERKAAEKELLKKIQENEIPSFSNNYFDWETWILGIIRGMPMREIYVLNDHQQQ